jgi:hypothetical protein
MNQQQGGINLQTILALVGLAALAWVVWPWIAPMIGGATGQGQGDMTINVSSQSDGGAVNQSTVIHQPPVVNQPPVVATPTLAPNAPEARPVDSSVTGQYKRVSTRESAAR